jgi:hypothetical protein
MELSNLLWSIAYSAPSLIVYLIATIMGMVYLNKYKSAALLAMLGGLLAGITALGSLVVRELMWAGARDNGNFEATANLTRIIGIGGSLVEAVGMGMIVFAVFAGRRPVARDDRDRDDRYDDRPRRDRDRRDDDRGPTPLASRPRS